MPHPLRSWHTRPGWSEFGAPRPNGSWKTHRGFDYYAPEGTPIYGTADGGRVVAIRYNPNPLTGFGHSIRIAYPNGVETLDAHLQARTPLQLGDPVDTDTVIGAVGKTGNAWRTIWRGMRNDHHEVFVDGVRVDPIEFHQTTEPDFEYAQSAQEEPFMYRIKQAENGGRITLVNMVTGLSTHVRAVAHVALLKRFRDNDESDRMYTSELELCQAYVAATWPAPAGAVDQEALIDRLATAVVDELKARL